MKITHATHQGSHLYKFHGLRIGVISKLLADGEPIDTSWLPEPSHSEVSHFFKFDHEVSTWSELVRGGGGRFVRNESENPFKFDLPSVIQTVGAMDNLAIDKGLMGDDDDEEDWRNPLLPFYSWEPDPTEEERPIVLEMRELGEIIPCPEVDFPWTVVEPFGAGVPCELWHLVRVQVSKQHVESLFWDWVEANKRELHIDSMYPRQSEMSVFFRVGSGSLTSIHIGKEQSFVKLLSRVEGENLECLRVNLQERLEILKQKMMDASPLFQCPKCDGAGALPCPRCAGAGVTDKGVRAEEAKRDLLSRIHSIKGSRGRDTVEDAVRAAEKLWGFCLVD